mgnify:CR=1 FL=1
MDVLIVERLLNNKEIAHNAINLCKKQLVILSCQLKSVTQLALFGRQLMMTGQKRFSELQIKLKSLITY